MNTVFELMEKTASKLSRKPVKLNFRNIEGCYGLCWKDSKGFLNIELQTGLEEEQLLKTYLHEIGHCKMHTFTASEVHPSESKVPEQENKIYSAIREAQAEAISKYLFQYAENNRNIEQPYFEGCLWSLYNSPF